MEYPTEEEKMETIQNLTIIERENFLNLVLNLTSELNDEELQSLRTYIIHGPDYDSVRSVMLNTNQVVPRGNILPLTNNPRLVYISKCKYARTNKLSPGFTFTHCIIMSQYKNTAK